MADYFACVLHHRNFWDAVNSFFHYYVTLGWKCLSFDFDGTWYSGAYVRPTAGNSAQRGSHWRRQC